MTKFTCTNALTTNEGLPTLLEELEKRKDKVTFALLKVGAEDAAGSVREQFMFLNLLQIWHLL
eukprot:UN23916